MKRITVLGTALLLLAVLAGCDSADTPDKTQVPDDFSFSLDFGIYGLNNIDTYSGTFTKDLVIAGTETIVFVVPADKMRETYEAFEKYKIAKMPDDINAEVEMIEGEIYTSSTPSNKYSLTYTCSGETRTVVCDDGGPWYADSGPPESRDNLVAFVEVVSEYIYGTEEYKSMPEAEGGYD